MKEDNVSQDCKVENNDNFHGYNESEKDSSAFSILFKRHEGNKHFLYHFKQLSAKLCKDKKKY